MAIREYQGKKPQIAADCFVAESADIIGDVTIGAGSSIWYGAVLRGDVAPIVIGKHCSVQDNCTIHVDYDQPTILGDYVTVGHNVVVHGATVDDNCLIGINSTVLDGAHLGHGCQVGAGALVAPRKDFPPRSQLMGMPAKVVKELNEADEQGFIAHAQMYTDLAKDYLAEQK